MKRNQAFIAIPPRVRTHHRRLQNFVELSGTAGQRWKVKEVSILAQWARGPDRVGISERYFFEATFKHN